MPGQTVTGDGELALSPIVWGGGTAEIEPASLDRSFDREIVEVMDKEQVEMRHDDN